MIRRPPSSPLFPYTPLFRSHWRTAGPADGEPVLMIMGLGGSGRMWWRLKPHLADPDRKSTRLNSSHPSISYAVFCLKKKKNGSRAVGLLDGAPVLGRPRALR